MSEISQLKAAREAAGLTVEQVSNKTNIRAGVIEDLEKNSVEVCGGIAYARGHIRSIARVIKADGDLLVAAIEAAQNIDSRKIIDQLYDNNIADRPKEKKVMKFSTLAAAAAIILGIGFVISIALGNASTTKSKIEITPSQSATPTTSESATPTAAGAVNLTFTGVNGKTWVGIIDATGKQVFDGQIKSGETQSFTNANSLKVTIGNAAAVKVTLNGTDLGVAGGYGEVLHVNYTSTGAIKE
ncbi:MAG: helix-turn-helix domain-containing protein [Actinomycetes bacterium]